MSGAYGGAGRGPGAGGVARAVSAAGPSAAPAGRAPWLGAGVPRSPALWRRRARGARFRPAVGPLSLALATLLFCWKLVLPGLVVIGYDTMTYMYPYRHFAAAALADGRVPLWNPYIYYGAPFLANLQSAVFYPPHVLFLLRPATEAMNWSVVVHLFLCAFFAYLLARRLLGQDAVAATVAGALFGLSGFVGSQVGHLNQLNAAAWLPAALLAAHLALTTRRARWVALLALVMAVQLLAGHAQETYMTAVLLGLYGAFFALRRLGGAGHALRSAGQTAGLRRWGASAAGVAREWAWVGLVLGGAGVLAAGMAALQLLPTNELTGLSIRAGGMSSAEASSFSLPPRQLFVGLLPTFGLAAPTSNEYLGWVGFGGLTLALVGLLFRAWRPAVVFFGLLAPASFLLALGNHTPLFAYTFQVPGMDLFRVPARWLMLTSLALAMLAGEGLAALRGFGHLDWPQAGPWQRLAGATRLLLGVVAALALAGVLWPFQRAGAEGFPPPLLWIWLILAGGAVALAFVALASAPSTWPSLAFAGWVFVELFAASRSLEYNNPNPESVYTATRPVIDALHQGQGPDRRLLSTAATGYHPSDAEGLVGPYRDRLGEKGVLATLINTKYKEIVSPNLSMVFGVPTIDGYDGGVLPLRRYLTFKGVAVPPEANLPDALLRDQLRQLPPAPRLRLLGPTHLLVDAMGDVTREGVFYDLLGTALVPGGETLRLTRVAAGPGASTGAQATGVGPIAAVGLVTALEGAGAVPDGALIATVTVGDASGTHWRADLVAGRDTAEGVYSPTVRHRQPPPLTPERPGPSLYLTRLPADGVQQASWVAVQSHLPAPMGRLRLHAVTLIGRAAATDAGGGAQAWPLTIAGDALRLVHRSDVKLYRVEDALPRAYVVQQATVVDGADAAVAALTADGHRPERVAVLERDSTAAPAEARSGLRARVRAALDRLEAWLGVSHGSGEGTVGGEVRLPPALQAPAADGAPGARVTWIESAPERIALRVESPAPGLLVVRDTFYPGWSASVDGSPAPLLRADVVFRGVPVGAGTQTVELRYRSLAFERGLQISAVAAALTLALALLPAARRRRPAPIEVSRW